MARKAKLVQMEFEVRNRKRFEEMSVRELQAAVMRLDARRRWLVFLLESKFGSGPKGEK